MGQAGVLTGAPYPHSSTTLDCDINKPLNDSDTPIRKNTCTPMFIAALLTIARIWKQPKCPSVDEWIKKMRYISTMEYYMVMKKKELLPFATAWMDVEIMMLSEISPSEKDKYHMISLMWNIMNKLN